MVIMKALATAALGTFFASTSSSAFTNTSPVAGSTAQFAQFSGSNYAISVNVPSDTASSGSGSIYLQISAPSGTQWVGFGQGSQMAGANMFVVYAADSNNVTVSPRLGTGQVQPRVNSDAQVSVLEGTGITSSGAMVANIRCDSCLSWNGGSMDPTDSSSSWIWAYKTGDALDSTSVSESISQHDTEGAFSLDLTTGTGGSSPNPFAAASGTTDSSSSAAPSGTSGPSQTAAASGAASETATATTTSAGSASTGGVSNPLVGTDPSNAGTSTSVTDPNKSTRIAHATIMSLTFVLLFPLSSLTIYLGYREKVRHIHGPLQAVSIILMLVGLGLGVKLADKLDEIDEYHQVIGFVLVAWMVFFQPVLGLLQHLHFRKNGTRSPMGHGHRWAGRAFILLGIVNGGLGFKQSGKVGSTNVPTYSVVVYSVFAVVIFLIYIAVVILGPRMSARNGSNAGPGEKPRPRSQGYEMHNRSADGRGFI
ncbi:hypothetical protein PV08_04366 [Exophiala spinifera]|uniref:DOMON domain-containing protein n=1 Tax=Exophiala spinifera TaxID=91928 RepID=A0A0D2BEW9_9EURO|nr:uncharacterized protein PV08_04366 [Exophiala spinifera]KIW17175.1 hypothetical protein PV08_04366 [Exophiala spinifera]